MEFTESQKHAISITYVVFLCILLAIVIANMITQYVIQRREKKHQKKLEDIKEKNF